MRERVREATMGEDERRRKLKGTRKDEKGRRTRVYPLYMYMLHVLYHYLSLYMCTSYPSSTKNSSQEGKPVYYCI